MIKSGIFGCLLLVCLLFACEKQNEQIIQKKNLQDSPNTKDLIGSWINPQYLDSLVIYDRSDSLKENNYGFSFKLDNKFIERKNSGWCGTPPISYADYNGTFEINDTIVTINVAYWGGKIKYVWKIVSIDDDNLKIIWEDDSVIEN